MFNFDIRVLKNMQNINARGLGLGLGHDLTICLNLVEATCAKTLVWSFLLCFLVMTVWSMLMVEMVHPLLKTLPLECKGCDRAMSSATWQVPE